MSQTLNRSVSYKDWHIPLSADGLSLRQARANLDAVGEGQQSIPLMVQLVENPKFRMPGVTLFHGAVDLAQHDCIHMVLGRGLLPKDEAFTIGFTMGTTNKVTTSEETLFAWISQYLYPDIYRFDSEEIKVFRDAVRLGFISSCEPLDQVDFTPYLDVSLAEVRQTIKLEKDLLLAYYAIEQRRYPQAPESQRLLTSLALPG